MSRRSPNLPGKTPEGPTQLRIIGGRLRGRKFGYHGDPLTRPMKDRVREAVFNLVGYEVKGKHAVDLFAGTGALGLEAMSRGAAGATFIERHFPTAAALRQNLKDLEVQNECRVVASDTFFWSRNLSNLLRTASPAEEPLLNTPWVVFCSPPYALYYERQGEMLDLIRLIAESAPAGSAIVVESDSTFDMNLLPAAECWDVRSYEPALIAIGYLPLERSEGEAGEDNLASEGGDAE